MIIYDVETEKAILGRNEKADQGIDYCAGFGDFANMGISVIGVYDYSVERPRVFLEDNFEEFQKLIDAAECVVGFNNHKFDNKLLDANNIKIPLEKSYDILEEIWKSLGIGTNFHPETHGGLSLDALVYANFKICKNGKGADAPKLWQCGRQGEVIDYCLADVELTRRLTEKILKSGKLRNPKTNLDICIRRPLSEVK